MSPLANARKVPVGPRNIWGGPCSGSEIAMGPSNDQVTLWVWWKMPFSSRSLPTVSKGVKSDAQRRSCIARSTAASHAAKGIRRLSPAKAAWTLRA